MKNDCIFCRLANGEIPTRSIYEDEDFRVILDAAPATRGHALILPKEHADNIYNLPEELAGKAFILAKRLASFMTDRLGCEGFNIVQNNGEAAGQTVFHFHMHLIPRYEDDGQGAFWQPRQLTDEALDEICNQLTKQEGTAAE
ncbi:MAG: HIT family protein [bacterium]|nr:HIT family protein [bacterium]MCM1374688.1 HIT family protein [Muribaculum sp.]